MGSRRECRPARRLTGFAVTGAAALCSMLYVGGIAQAGSGGHWLAPSKAPACVAAPPASGPAGHDAEAAPGDPMQVVQPFQQFATRGGRDADGPGTWAPGTGRLHRLWNLDDVPAPGGWNNGGLVHAAGCGGAGGGPAAGEQV